MKPPISPSVVALLAVFATLAATHPGMLSSQQPSDRNGDSDERGMLPVAPQDLFAAMPGQLKSWEMIRSTAERRFGTWLESRAVREYERPLPAAEGQEEPATLVARARISITDTGRHPDAVAAFVDFVADEDAEDPDSDDPDGEEDDEPSEDAGLERKLINGHPAFVFRDGDREHDIEMLVGGRFVVHLLLENQTERFADEWLKRVRFRVLTSISDTELVELPEEIVITRIDQLNPRKNRAYLLATTSNARIDQELAEDDAWVQEALGEIPEIPEQPEGAAEDPDSPAP